MLSSLLLSCRKTVLLVTTLSISFQNYYAYGTLVNNKWNVIALITLKTYLVYCFSVETLLIFLILLENLLIIGEISFSETCTIVWSIWEVFDTTGKAFVSFNFASLKILLQGVSFPGMCSFSACTFCLVSQCFSRIYALLIH